MSALTFDTLGYAKKLEEAGFTRQQAEVQADAMREHVNAQNAAFEQMMEDYDESFRKELATKADLAALKTEIKQDMVNLKEHLADTKHEILKWMMGIVVAESALIVAVIGVGLAVLGK